MAKAFPSHNNPDCPDSSIDGIVFSDVTPAELPAPPAPIIDPLGFPLPIPMAPISCFCPTLTVGLTTDVTSPVGGIGTVTPIDGDCCDVDLAIDLNLPGLIDLSSIPGFSGTLDIPTLASLLNICSSGIAFTAGGSVAGVDFGDVTVTTTSSPDFCDYNLDFDFTIPGLISIPGFSGTLDIPTLASLLNICSSGIAFTAGGSITAGNPGGITVTTTSSPDFCDYNLDFDFTIPGLISIPGFSGTLDIPTLASLLGCQLDTLGGSINRSATSAGIHISESSKPGTGGSAAETWNGVVVSGSASTTFFRMNISGPSVPQVPNFFKGCVIKFDPGSQGADNNFHQIEESNWDLIKIVSSPPFSIAPQIDDTFVITCGGPTIVEDGGIAAGACDRLLTFDLDLPCTGLTFTGSLNAGPTGTSQLGNLDVVVISDEDCNATVGLNLVINVPFIARITGKDSSDPAKTANYFIEGAEITLSAYVVATNVAEQNYSPNLIHPDVPSGQEVFVFSEDDGTGGTLYYFYYYMEPADEPCDAAASPPLAASAATTSLYRVRLWPYPAGALKCITESSLSVHEITCVDVNSIGWLPVSNSIVPASAPIGAKFWYNFNTHIEDYNLFTLKSMYSFLFAGGFFSKSSLYMEIDGVSPPEQIIPGTNNPVLDNDPLVIYTQDGIWWMKNTWGNVPWSDSLALLQSENCIEGGYYYCPPQSYDRSYVFTYGYGYSSVYSPTPSAIPYGVVDKRLILNLFYGGI